MGLETRGKLYAKFEAQQVTERFRKREFVVELSDNPRYPQFVMFQLTGDRCEKLDDYQLGDELSIEFALRGREWTSPRGEVKYFNSLEVWDLASSGQAAEEEPPLPEGPPPGLDDIPF